MFRNLSVAMLLVIVASILVANQVSDPKPDDVDWISSRSPFDVRQFLRKDPSDPESLPALRRALSEFSPELAEEYGAASLAVIRERRNSLDALLSKTANQTPPHGRLSTVLAMYVEPLRRLRDVLKSDDISLTPLPRLRHDLALSGAVETASAVIQQQSLLHLAQGDHDAVVDDIALLLRLTRTTFRHGTVDSQRVMIRAETPVFGNIIPRLLSAPELTEPVCRQLVDVLVHHARTADDCWGEGVRSQYVGASRLLAALDHRGDESIITKRQAGLARLQEELRCERSVAARILGNLTLDDEVASLDSVTAELLRSSELDYPMRSERLLAIQSETAKLAGVVDRSAAPVIAFLDAAVYHQARVRAVRCLAAIKCQTLKTGDLPAGATLQSIAERAGLPGVPRDPFSTGPLGARFDADGIVVYSTGKNGKDDGGVSPADFDMKEGDLLFPMSGK